MRGNLLGGGLFGGLTHCLVGTHQVLQRCTDHHLLLLSTLLCQLTHGVGSTIQDILLFGLTARKIQNVLKNELTFREHIESSCCVVSGWIVMVVVW